MRFEQRYGFHISTQGEKLIKNALSLNLVEKLSGARILHELNLIFREDEPETCLRRLNELGVLAAIHPSLVLNADKNELLDSLREVIDWYRLLYFKETPELSTLYLMALCSAVPAIETAGHPAPPRADAHDARRNPQPAGKRAHDAGGTHQLAPGYAEEGAGGTVRKPLVRPCLLPCPSKVRST